MMYGTAESRVLERRATMVVRQNSMKNGFSKYFLDFVGIVCE
jgi:hypothetical protein